MNPNFKTSGLYKGRFGQRNIIDFFKSLYIPSITLPSIKIPDTTIDFKIIFKKIVFMWWIVNLIYFLVVISQTLSYNIKRLELKKEVINTQISEEVTPLLNRVQELEQEVSYLKGCVIKEYVHPKIRVYTIQNGPNKGQQTTRIKY